MLFEVPFLGTSFFCFPKIIQKHEIAINITFLIKSIMNKKLFSWKALAGLALLVAMGLTSCKQATEVDPNDPYNTTKPTKPSSSLDGDYDWEVTIAKTSDFADQWKSVADKVKKAVAEADGIDIKINCGAYALDGKTLTIPAIWKSAEGKIVNIVFSGSFKSKADSNGNALALDVNTDNLAGAEVNIYLPTDEFNFNLDASEVKANLYGESTTLDLFAAQANTNKKNGMTIGDGVEVGIITMSGALLGTDNVNALLVNGDISLKEGKGAQVGNQEVYVKSLFVVADAKVSGADKAALENVTVIDNTTLTLGSAKSQIESIVGLGTAKKPTTLAMAGDVDDFSKIDAISNVTIKGNKKDAITGAIYATNIDDISKFTDVIFDMDVNLSESASDLEFDGDVNIKVEDNSNIKFTNVDFGKKALVYVAGTETVKSKKSVVKMFQWEKSSKKYVEVKDDDEDNLTAANAKSEGVDIIQSLSRTWDALSDPTINNLSWDGLKFHHDVVEAAEDALNGNSDKGIDGAKKAYDDLVASSGIAAANGSVACANYQKAWERLYGKAKTVKKVDDKNNPVKVSFTAYTDKELYDMYYEDGTISYWDYVGPTYNGYYRYYAKELAFVKDANGKIDGSDWYTIYYQSTNTSTVEPEDVVITFTDCTFGGKTLTVAKLNELLDGSNAIDPTFTSAKEAWFKVNLDGEALTWKKITGGYILE